MGTTTESSRRGRKRGRWLFLVFLALVLPSCGLYSTHPGSLPGHIKTLAVPAFDNRTTQVGLDEEITQAVIQSFVSDNHLKIVAESDANAVLTGAVVDYKNTVFGFTGREQAQEYRVTITVAVRLMDKVKNRELWRDDDMVKTQNYYVISVPGQEPQDEVSGRKQAVQKIADEILSRTIENW
jgi:outer membrane lipopolysaccharide assembly protein LptE/RlpB